MQKTQNPIEMETPKIKEFFIENQDICDVHNNRQNSLVKFILSSQKQPSKNNDDLFEQMLDNQSKIQEFRSPEKNKNKLDFFYSIDFQFNKHPIHSSNHKSRSDEKKKEIQRRKRKSYMQIKVLMNEFDPEEEWSKEKITQMSRKTGLSESQVYKWCWDQKKKQNEDKVSSLQKTKPKISKFDLQDAVTPKKLFQ